MDDQIRRELKDVQARMEQMVGWRLLVPFDAGEAARYQAFADRERALLTGLRFSDRLVFAV
jgi:hypothetical protein